MAKIIICSFCHQQVDGDELVAHLVGKHHWTEVNEVVPPDLHSKSYDSELTDASPVPMATELSIAEKVELEQNPCACSFCKKKINPTLAVKHMHECPVRMKKQATKGKKREPNRERVTCGYCKNKVDAQNIVKHIRRSHLSVPTSVITKPQVPSSKQVKLSKPKVVMTSRRGTRITGLGLCDKCKEVHTEHWIYKFSDGTSQTVCRFCKGALLDKAANRKIDILDRCLPGSALNGKRQ